MPHIVYANSTHSGGDTIYGNSKRRAGEILASLGSRYTDLVLPHIFGECALPDYNNVTATLIDRLWNGEQPTIAAGASVSLLHAGEAAELAIRAVIDARSGKLAPVGRHISVADLWTRLQSFHQDYQRDIFPVLDDSFEVALFNSYRSAGFPTHYPKSMHVRADARGVLFETSKGRGGSQSFISTTLPGQSRGDHFHLSLVERFLVVSGRATIRVRRVLTDEIISFEVSGEKPVAVDMPPLHTHHIVNNGEGEVITYFWASRLFDPADPDTYADPVVKVA
jgi:UDP-2-acetamido-2,6-beta-L-arabino-hexul-4-ose reductase